MALRMASLVVAGLGLLGAAPERGDPTSRISKGSSASEYWDFVASFESNQHLFVRFLISNEWPGDASAIAVGHFVRADGKVLKFHNGRLAGRWTLGEGGRWLKVGGSRLDLSGPELALDIDKKKTGVQIHLQMRPGPRASAGPELPETGVDVLALAAPIEGTISFEGMAEPLSVRGHAGITHTWTERRESEHVLRRIDFFGRDGALALYLGEAQSPDGRRAQVVSVERNGKPILNVTEVTISHGDEKLSELGPGYPVPKQLTLTARGFSGVIHLNQMLVRHEPFQDLPLPFRFLLSSAAHPQRVWMDSRFEVRIEQGPSSTPLQAQGIGIASVTFTNPLPSTTSKRHVTDQGVSSVKVGILNNLRAGQSGKTVSRVLSLLSAYPDVMHVETDHAAALPEALADFARRGIDLLVVNGGDGTLQHTLTEILAGDDFERIPMIAPLRGGRTNMTALDLGAQRDPVKGLASVLEAVRTRRLAERMVRRPVLRVAYHRGFSAQYGMFFGAGMIQRAIALTHRLFPRGRSHGVLGPGLVTASLIGKTILRPRNGVLTPDKVQMLLDGESVPQGEFRLVIASSLNRLFLRMNPFWGQGPGPVRFTCAASGSQNIPKAAIGILRGRPKPFVTTEAGYTSKNVQRAELRFDCGFTVDGEIFAPRSDETVTLTGDRRVTFVRA